MMVHVGVQPLKCCTQAPFGAVPGMLWGSLWFSLSKTGQEWSVKAGCLEILHKTRC